jgi:CDP-paratose 2-epimerase
MMNSLSLLELFTELENIFDIKMKFRQLPWRESDQKVFVADNKKISSLCNWQPQVSSSNGIKLVLGL